MTKHYFVTVVLLPKQALHNFNKPFVYILYVATYLPVCTSLVATAVCCISVKMAISGTILAEYAIFGVIGPPLKYFKIS